MGDVVLPTDNLTTWQRDQPVKVRMGEGHLADTPISIPTAFSNVVKKLSHQTALAVKRGGQWKKWSYAQYLSDVKQAAKALIKLGLEPYHGVGIIGFNTPEWFISDLGAIYAGGFAVGIYTTNSAEACQYVAENSECNIIVVENDMQLQKVLKVKEQLPHLKAIVQYEGNPKQNYPDVYSWAQFMDIGKGVADDVLAERMKGLAPNKCCTLIYTSGTTGNPKGVMCSHDNFTWTGLMVGRMAKLTFGQDHLISYLPLSHVAAQLLDIYIPILFGGCVWFAQPDALKGTLGDTLKEVRPTAFFGVPRVWEKMQEKMVAVGKANSNMKKKIALWAKDIGLKGNTTKKKRGSSMPFGWSIANALVFKKVKAALGLDRCRFCLTGAAPIARETLNFFMSLDVPLMEIYGMSESSGPHTVSFPWKYQTGSVGYDMWGATTKLDNADADGNGEICMSGRHIMMGYLNNKEKTEETIDSMGWLHSGDVGKVDKNGFLFITGRIKELLITAGGENVAPVPIEDVVKEELPCVSNAMLIGDKKKFLAMLLTCKVEVDPDSMVPKDELTDPAKDWVKLQGSNATRVSQILDTKDEKVLQGIQNGIDRANKRAPSNAQRIQKWSILPVDFSIPGGELGPTLKTKRPVVHKKYNSTVNAFYGE